MQHSLAFLLFCLFFSASAFSQNSGTIQCDPAAAISVPAWIAPGIPYVVKQLPCGQLVSVLGMERSSVAGLEYSSRPRAYAKIQIAENVGYVDARYIMVSKSQARISPSESENAAVERSSAKQDEEQKKWDLITGESLKFRDEMLLDPIYTNGPRTFTATVSNNSEVSVSQLRLLVRLYDCSGKPEKDYSNCDNIGEVKPVVTASIPPGQTRRVAGSALFEATPRVRGTFAWGYRILGIRAE